MKLNPQQAPLYGECVLTVRLTEERELADDAVFYLLFAGSTLKHLTSTRKVNSATLETITPGHDCCERVKVLLCASKKGFCLVVAEEDFEFVPDEAYDSAQFLAANAGNQQALIFARFLDKSRPPSGDVTILDEKITLAFRHLQLPSGWNMLGAEPSIKDGQLQETLMHFAARLGLCRLSRFLLQQPGGRRALSISNSEGATPLSLALERGFLKLQTLLAEEETAESGILSEPSHVEHSGDFCVKHHCGLNVYTLTKKSQTEAQINMETTIEELNKYMENHSLCQLTPPVSHMAKKTTLLLEDAVGLKDQADKRLDYLLKASFVATLVTLRLIFASAWINNAVAVWGEQVQQTSQKLPATKHRQTRQPSRSATKAKSDLRNPGPLSPGAGVKSELQAVSEGTDDLCCIYQETKKNPVDKSPDSETLLHLVPANKDCSEELSLKVLSENDCNSERVVERCTESDNRVETVGGEVALFSFESKNKDIETEEEEVGSMPIVESENVSVINDHTQSSSTEVHTVENLLSGGNPNEETGMTSTGIILDQESLCVRDNKNQEMITAEETATPNTVVVEERSKSSDLTKADSVNMGQSMSGYCTSTASTMEVQSGTENLELQSGEMEPLLNRSINSDENRGITSDQELSSCPQSLNPTVESQTEDSRLDCQRISEIVEKVITEDSQVDKCLENIITEEIQTQCFDSNMNGESQVESLNLIQEDGLLSLVVDVNGNLSQLTEEHDASHSLHCERLSNEKTDRDCKEPAVIKAADENVVFSDCTITTDCPKCESQGEVPTTSEMENPISVTSQDTDNILKTIISTENKENENSAAHSEISNSSWTENPQVQKTCLCHNEEQHKETDTSLTACHDFSIVSVAECKTEEASSISELQSLTELNVESCIAEVLQDIIRKLETTSPVLSEHVQQQQITCDENTELPPSGQAESVQEGKEISVYAEGELNKVSDTPSLFNNYECQQNQEVLTEDSVHSDTSTEMQEAVTATSQQNSEQLQISTCEEDKTDGKLDVMLCETDSCGSQDEILSMLLSNQREKAEADNVENKLPCNKSDTKFGVEFERSTAQDNQSESKGSAITANELIFGIMVENGDKTAKTVTPYDILGTETSCLEKEEPEDDVKKPLAEYNKDEDDSEVVTVSRASLHPIAEESLLNGDSSSDTASTSSESDVSSDGSVSESQDPNKEEINEETLDLLSPTDHHLCEAEDANVHLHKGPNGLIPVEDGIVTDSTLLLSHSSQSPVVLNPDALQDKEDYVQDSSEVSHALKEDDSGLDLSINMEEIACPSLSDTEIASAESHDGKAEDEVDFVKQLQTSPKTQTINKESCCSIDPCLHSDLLEPKQSKESTECGSFFEDALVTESSSQQKIKRDSASDSDLSHMSAEALDEMVFTKLEEEQSLCDAASSSSSVDDTTSLERNSSHGSDISLPHTSNTKKYKDRHSVDSSCSSTVTASVEERESENAGVSEMEGEEMDSITEVSPHLSRSKRSMRSLSPYRRHSWEPAKHTANDAEINRRSSFRVLGDVVKKPSVHRRSMSWCPSDAHFTSMGGDFNYRSYSLEGLAGDGENKKNPAATLDGSSAGLRRLTEDRGSLVSLTEEEQESDQRAKRNFQHKNCERSHVRGFGSAPAPHLTKSMSLMAISQPSTDTQCRIRPKRRISFSFNISPLVPKSKHVFSIGSSSSDDESDSSRSLNSRDSSLAQSISEESCNNLPPSPSRKDLEGKSGTKVSRTFSYLRNKMSSGKKSKEKEKDKTKEKDKDSKEKEKDKKTLNGHLFSSTPIVGPITCYNCTKNFTNKDGYICANCNSIVHKGCRESYTPCAKVKMKQQKVLQPHDTSSLPVVIMRNKGSQAKERPRSAIVAPDENNFIAPFSNRRPQTLSISKSISSQNIAGVGDESLLGTWKYLSQSTDSLHKISKVNESMESLIDEGTDMNEGQLMGEFEMDSRQLEAESWSQVVDSKFLRQQKKDVVKRQDVLYELMQTEMHHIRTLKIMSDVYSRGMVMELQFEQHVVEKIFPCLEDLLNIHSQFFQRILERKKESMAEKSEKNFVIKRIGDLLVNQFSGENAERMKKTYGKFCGHHNEAVNYFKDLLSKEKRFQAFIKKKMSSTVVRRLGIPECILLVTQRITKYPVLLQRILQYTKENDVEHQDVSHSLNLVKDVITAVNSKVRNYEKKMRLHEIYNKTDSKSIQRMKSGQMFAKEDLKRRKLVRDGLVSLKSTTGRSKEVLAVLQSDILVFLQEKDQKYVFASLDQKSTVISLRRLIVREVAHEEKGLFLISMGASDPEMVEVHASSKEERNSWIQTIQDTINTMNKDEDEGVPSESEEERRILDTKARELKDQLHLKDKQIILLLEEKEKIFQSLTDCYVHEDSTSSVTSRIIFRANTEEAPKGEPVIKDAVREVETLHCLVNKHLWGNVGQQAPSPTDQEAGVGPVSLPRRAETFGGFDSHQLNVSKSGEKDEGEDLQDLRRTESDSVLKKGINANLMFKRNSEQVLQSVTNLHNILSTLQAVVLQQDTYIEDQKLLLSERALTRTSSRPNSLIEQEKQRSLEKQRQELANLQKQQAQHLEEKRKREREWEVRERELVEREAQIAQKEESAKKSIKEIEQERNELQNRKEEYQLDLERLRTAQKQLEKEREQLKKDMERVSETTQRTDRNQVSCQHDKLSRVPSLPIGADSSKRYSSNSPKQEHLEAELSASPKKDSLLRTDSKQKGKSHFHLLGTNQTNKSVEGPTTNRLFNLSKPKEKKDKKKKGKCARSPTTDSHSVEGAVQEEEIFC
ncbi:A-kinase anchor protein 13 [Rhinophrynus dorsalis]